MRKRMNKYIFSCFLIFSVFLSIISSFSYGFSKKIDGIVAVVNHEVITLTDLRIVKDFGLYDLRNGAYDEPIYKSVLENMINQKMVQQFTGSDINIDKKEVDQYLESLKKEFKDSGWEEKLIDFGITLPDLRDYCTQYLSYKKTISERFSRSVVVSLKDIEEYYNQVYIPEQKARGETIQQMVDILPEIESAVKEKITKVQAREWIKKLRNQAEIQIRLDGYIDFLQEIGK